MKEWNIINPIKKTAPFPTGLVVLIKNIDPVVDASTCKAISGDKAWVWRLRFRRTTRIKKIMTASPPTDATTPMTTKVERLDVVDGSISYAIVVE